MTHASQLIDQVAVYHEDAFAWAVTCCAGNADAAADAIQECYIKVAASRARFSGRSSLKTWWFAVIRITALEQLRGQQRWRRMVDAFRDWIGFADAALPPDAEPPAAADPDRLAAALERLPPRQSEILHLVFQHELSVSDAAAVMGVSVGSARQHYERAKKRLRQELAAEAAKPERDHEA